MSDTIKDNADKEAKNNAERDMSRLTDGGNHGANSDDGQSGGADSGFDIVLSDNETNHQGITEEQRQINRQNAERRLQRKQEKQMRERREAIERGELPDHLKVNPELPSMPDFNDFMGDDVLWDKFGGDEARARQAYSAAIVKWNEDSFNARSNAQATQAQRIQDLRKQSTEAGELVKKFYDDAEKLGLPDFEEKEDSFRASMPEGVDIDIMRLFPEKAAAMIYYLGSNPKEIERIKAVGPQIALVELTRLESRLTVKPRNSQRSGAPDPDSGVQGGPVAGGVERLKTEMDKAARNGDTKRFLELERQVKAASKGARKK